MKIYNSLTRKKEPFEAKKGQVGMYVCGPTVYDEPHIGHARASYIFEVVRNYFKYKGYKVNFVKNITDVDDKIIARAKEELPNTEINEAVKKIAEKYTKAYYEDMKALGISRASHEPRATEHIKEMQGFISNLIKKKFAYEIDGNVYFDVRRFKDYGKLSGQNLDQMRSAVRIEKDKKKKDALDFALWKKASEDEPFWDSPWGRGRPGWHIECSVMASIYLGDEFDIHAGGRDLIFPHHENEIAQSRCFNKKRFARIWMHNGLLTINQQKMAKSLGNFISVKKFLKKYHPDVLKLFFLQTHYSQPIDFTWERMEEKREALYRITSFLKRVKQREKEEQLISAPNIKAISPKELRSRIEEAREDFEKSIDDDFNTPNAIAVLFEIISICNNVLVSINFTRKHLPSLKYAAKTVRELGNILAITFKVGPLSMPEKEIKSLIKLRDGLREKKMFEDADKIRKGLAEEGIILEDTKEGTKWDIKL